MGTRITTSLLHSPGEEFKPPATVMPSHGCGDFPHWAKLIKTLLSRPREILLRLDFFPLPLSVCQPFHSAFIMLSTLQGAHHSQLPTCPSSLMETHEKAEQKGGDNAKLKIPPAAKRGAEGHVSSPCTEQTPSSSCHAGRSCSAACSTPRTGTVKDRRSPRFC